MCTRACVHVQISWNWCHFISLLFFLLLFSPPTAAFGALVIKKKKIYSCCGCVWLALIVPDSGGKQQKQTLFSAQKNENKGIASQSNGENPLFLYSASSFICILNTRKFPPNGDSPPPLSLSFSQPPNQQILDIFSLLTAVCCWPSAVLGAPFPPSHYLLSLRKELIYC